MKKNIVAIIQARMGSSRLPGKVLKTINGISLLEIIVHRVMRSANIDSVCVAIPHTTDNLPIINLCVDLSVPIFQGDEIDVLSRYYYAATEYKADIIVRITADNPLVDPEIIDECISELIRSNCDYASNTIKVTYPEGLNIEVFTYSALKRSFEQAQLPSEREHVCPYMWKNPEIFSLINIQYNQNYSHWRWTVDKEVDLHFFHRLFEESQFSVIDIGYEKIIKYLNQHPEITHINSSIPRNEGYKHSLRYDTITHT